jgi:hypothetical protein
VPVIFTTFELIVQDEADIPVIGPQASELVPYSAGIIMVR